MARVLIGWELGAGRGHVVALTAMAEALTARGHEVALALQRFDSLPARLPACRIFQAPLWPGLLGDTRGANERSVSTIIDILARLGLDRPRTLKHLVTAWDAIFASYQPDIVIGDHAPALIVGAQGRIPSIATGPGFQVPPDTDPVARLNGKPPAYDEAALLDIIDADLHEVGRPPLEHLGRLFHCTRPLIASFVELDPYRRTDVSLFCAPALERWASPGSERAGEEVFVYVNTLLSNAETFWRGLHASGLPIRAHGTSLTLRTRALLDQLGIKVEPQPVAWTEIARRSRVVVSLGGHGTLCSALLAGLPHLAFCPDLEKILHAEAAARLGLGRACSAQTATAAALGEAVRSLYEDESAVARARAAAPAFQARMSPSFPDRLVETVESLI